MNDDLPGVELKETRLFRRVEVGDLEPELCGGAPDHPKVLDLARRGNDKDGTLRIGQAPGARSERPRDARRHRHRSGARRIDKTGRIRGELHEPERIACGRDVQALERVGVEWRTGRLRHEVRRLAAVEPAQLENVEVGAVEQRGLPGPNCDEDGDRIGDQPPDREQECSGARVVEPVGVVEEDRAPAGRPPPLRAGSTSPPRRRTAHPSGRTGARALARARRLAAPGSTRGGRAPDGAAPAARRTAPRFGLDPAGLQDGEPIRRGACLLQERRLADPRLADHREDRAHPGPCVREQPVERLPLPLAPEEHGHPV